MKLHVLNTKLADYGFAKELDYADKTFHGHQKGVAIALINYDYDPGVKPLEVFENYLPAAVIDDDREKSLVAILNDASITKLYQRVTMEVGEQLVARMIVYVPYYVVDHTCFAPTLNFDNVDPHLDGVYEPFKVDIELLFVCDGMNRYTTFHGLLKNVSIWDAVDSIFDHKELLQGLGCVFKKESNQEFTLDFYNEVGEQGIMEFTSPNDLKDRLVSFRLIALGNADTPQT